jgi:hypothetical protein
LLSSQERPSLQALLRSRHPTLRHRRLSRTRHARSRYPGQMSHRWSTTRHRAARRRHFRTPLGPAHRLAGRPQREHISRSLIHPGRFRRPTQKSSLPDRASPDSGSRQHMAELTPWRSVPERGRRYGHCRSSAHQALNYALGTAAGAISAKSVSNLIQNMRRGMRE